MKQERQNMILKFITDQSIETQEELLEKLKQAGIYTTQATVSRDIKEMKLVKIAFRDGYKYAVAGANDTALPKFTKALADSVLQIDYAQNLLVVKTFAGMAQAVATCIDSIRSPDIIGCVAGDDAILVVARTEEKAQEMCLKMKTMIRTLP